MTSRQNVLILFVNSMVPKQTSYSLEYSFSLLSCLCYSMSAAQVLYGLPLPLLSPTRMNAAALPRLPLTAGRLSRCAPSWAAPSLWPASSTRPSSPRQRSSKSLSWASSRNRAAALVPPGGRALGDIFRTGGWLWPRDRCCVSCCYFHAMPRTARLGAVFEYLPNENVGEILFLLYDHARDRA